MEDKTETAPYAAPELIDLGGFAESTGSGYDPRSAEYYFITYTRR